jgi:hypothetical protein
MGCVRSCSDALTMTAVVLLGAAHFADSSATPRRTDHVEPADPEEAYDPLAKAAA